MKDMKKEIESLQIEPEEDYRGKKHIVVRPKINIAITTYYKGTALEGVTAKLEEYLDNAESTENNINCL